MIDVVDWHHVVVDHGGCGSTFAREPFPCSSRCGQMRQQHFDGDKSIQRSIEGFENNPHAATTDHANNFIGANTPQHVGVVRRAQQPQHRSKCLRFIFRIRTFGPLEIQVLTHAQDWENFLLPLRIRFDSGQHLTAMLAVVDVSLDFSNGRRC